MLPSWHIRQSPDLQEASNVSAEEALAGPASAHTPRAPWSLSLAKPRTHKCLESVQALSHHRPRHTQETCLL